MVDPSLGAFHGGWPSLSPGRAGISPVPVSVFRGEVTSIDLD
jgi:hypothetical protein